MKIKTPGTRTHHRKGFSLVEVVMALGIISFAFISLLGMLPLGLGTFRSAMDTSLSSHILQQISSQVQATDFDDLAELADTSFAFDDQGNKVSDSSPSTIYNVRIVLVQSGSQTQTELPGAISANLATLSVQIASNPGRQTLTSDASTGLWVATPGVNIATYSVFASRKK